MFPPDLTALAETVLNRYREAGWQLATAESCTGGLVAACLTAIPGASEVVERGFVTYSNQAKVEMLGVPAALIDEHGAVSAEVAAAMAIGALQRSHVAVAVSITGIAGPGGQTATKPVGLVYFGIAAGDRSPTVHRSLFSGTRTEIRSAAVQQALLLLLDAAPQPSLLA